MVDIGSAKDQQKETGAPITVSYNDLVRLSSVPAVIGGRLAGFHASVTHTAFGNGPFEDAALDYDRESKTVIYSYPRGPDKEPKVIKYQAELTPDSWQFATELLRKEPLRLQSDRELGRIVKDSQLYAEFVKHDASPLEAATKLQLALDGMIVGNPRNNWPHPKMSIDSNQPTCHDSSITSSRHMQVYLGLAAELAKGERLGESHEAVTRRIVQSAGEQLGTFYDHRNAAILDQVTEAATPGDLQRIIQKADQESEAQERRMRDPVILRITVPDRYAPTINILIEKPVTGSQGLRVFVCQSFPPSDPKDYPPNEPIGSLRELAKYLIDASAKDARGPRWENIDRLGKCEVKLAP